ncbi:hypothetical protein ABZW30_45305 [Kitasatospora sp. NPDC004669]|uniref:hypothetical protein n=1 Tax=Kitasatospora sp. NPDC004669 TaxID=3154555 RepID=UPI0033B610EF
MPFAELALDGIDTVFAISDQGAAGAFTALRLAANTLPAGSNGRALVLVKDQATVLQGPPIPEDTRPTRDMAVALVLDRDGTLGAPRIRQHAGVSTSGIVNLLRGEAEEAEAVTAICRPAFARTGRRPVSAQTSCPPPRHCRAPGCGPRSRSTARTRRRRTGGSSSPTTTIAWGT